MSMWGFAIQNTYVDCLFLHSKLQMCLTNKKWSQEYLVEEWVLRSLISSWLLNSPRNLSSWSASLWQILPSPLRLRCQRNSILRLAMIKQPMSLSYYDFATAAASCSSIFSLQSSVFSITDKLKAQGSGTAQRCCPLPSPLVSAAACSLD